MVRKLYYIHRMNNERRFFARLKRSLPITLLDSEVKSKNISPEGVYFEVTTKDIKNYSPGRVIMIQIEVIYSKPELPEKRVWVAGFGEIIRVDEKEIINKDRKLGVALKFIKELEIFPCKMTIGVGFIPDYQQDQHNNQII